MSGNPAAHKRLVASLIEDAFNHHDLDAIDRSFAEDLAGPIREHARELLAAFPDLSVRIEDLVAEGDRIAARLLLSGVHAGAFAGIPPTHRRATWSSFRFYRIVNGRIVETWAVQDRLGLLEQLGATLRGASTANWASAVGTRQRGS